MGQYQPKPVMEINIGHPVLKSLRALIATNEEDQKAIDTANVLYESSAIASGYGINDPQSFAQRMTRVLGSALGIEDMEVKQEEKKVVEEKKVEEKEEVKEAAPLPEQGDA